MCQSESQLVGLTSRTLQSWLVLPALKYIHYLDYLFVFNIYFWLLLFL